MYFWRSQRGTEVDFILYGRKVFYAFEVKNSARIRPDDLTGLTEFAKDYPESRRILLYRGTDRLLKNDILCLPAEHFLQRLVPDTHMEIILS